MVFKALIKGAPWLQSVATDTQQQDYVASKYGWWSVGYIWAK